ncbi:response regulator transcription factor [Andreprevotia chitinilytica]|uniref:response regulator transcription factor n=1 Tax=Andreprevotia chitinilytica TaxID=396808 RepID=UPI000553EB41|nr:response regulator transcription factor [Andreprevotia chitinilytica]
MRIIGLADDHPVIMDALQATLAAANECCVAFKARTGEQLLKALNAQPCSIVITDYSMNQGALGGDGLAMIERVRRLHPEVKIIVFTMLSNPALLQRLSKLGVHALVSKNDEMSEVVTAIRKIEGGSKEAYASPSMRNWLADSQAQHRPNQPVALLTQRELEVVRLFAQGNTLQDISANLGRAVTTVATHKQNAMQKLGIASNADLICYAYEVGIV